VLNGFDSYGFGGERNCFAGGMYMTTNLFDFADGIEKCTEHLNIK
jgi:hypothetical protein